MISRIAILPVIVVLGAGGFILHINGWLISGISAGIGVVAIVADTVLERRKRAREVALRPRT